MVRELICQFKFTLEEILLCNAPSFMLSFMQADTMATKITRNFPQKKPNRLNAFRCSICSEVFKWRSQLKRHLRNHTEEKPNENTQSKKHTSQERSFNCEQCYKSFGRQQHLERHVRSRHQGLKPYQCTECDDSFKKKAELISHTRRAHDTNVRCEGENAARVKFQEMFCCKQGGVHHVDTVLAHLETHKEKQL